MPNGECVCTSGAASDDGELVFVWSGHVFGRDKAVNWMLLACLVLVCGLLW